MLFSFLCQTYALGSQPTPTHLSSSTEFTKKGQDLICHYLILEVFWLTLERGKWVFLII